MKKKILSAMGLLLIGVMGFAQQQQIQKAQTSEPKEATSYQFPKIEEEFRLIDQKEIEKIIGAHDKNLLVINFWATWCPPCVAELPLFQKAHETHISQGVQIVGFNMDRPAYGDEWKKTMRGTVERMQVRFPQFALNIDPEVTVPYFSQEWQGELPATFYFDRQGKKLGERLGAVDAETLAGDIEGYLSNMPAREEAKEGTHPGAPPDATAPAVPAIE